MLLASGGHLIAALLLPLYYLADATITLLRRLVKGEAIMKAHRSHFYQRALDNGSPSTASSVAYFSSTFRSSVSHFATLVTASPALHAAAALAGCFLVGLLLARFSRVKQ